MPRPTTAPSGSTSTSESPVNALTWVGLVLVAGSYGQLLVPRRAFDHPVDFLQGLPIVPAGVLAISATLFTLGVILIGEGICRWLGAPSLCSLAFSDPVTLGRITLAGAAAGLAMELVGQWLAKLWTYPYWTVWFYALVVIPGFAFYWLSIVETYLAAKAVLDRLTRPRHAMTARSARFAALGLIGAVALIVAIWLYFHWYAQSSKFPFTIATVTIHAPPFAYGLLAFAGLWLLAEWALRRRGSPSLIGAAAGGYWVPPAAIVVASVILSVVMEPQNAVHRLWAYQHFPWPGSAFAGVPLSVFAAWPLQYVTFLVLASLLAPKLAGLFWPPPLTSFVAGDLRAGDPLEQWSGGGDDSQRRD
jgi:hypothetical protein